PSRPRACTGSAFRAHAKAPPSPLGLSTPQTRPATAVVPHARLGSRLWWGVGGLGGVAITAALWWLAPWRAWLTPTASAPPPSRDMVRVSQAPPPAVPTDTAAGRGAPVPAPSRLPRPPSRARVPAPAPAGGGADSAPHPPVALREDSVVRSLRARALNAMNRAIDAGATPAELARADTVFKGAESLSAQSRLPEAMVQRATAASLG